MKLITPELAPLSLDLILVGGVLLVLIADLVFSGMRAQRALGYLAALVLATALVGSFFVPIQGTAFSGTYVGDSWSLFFKRTFIAAGFLAVLGSIDHVARHQPRRQGEYYLLLLFSLVGMSLLPSARDLILLMVCFELMSIPLFVLASYAKTDRPAAADSSSKLGQAPEAGLKLYLVGVASTALTLFGLSLVFGVSGTTSIQQLLEVPPSPLLIGGMILVLAGLGFKIGVVPFHMWVPDTYQGAPTPFVAFLSVAPKLAGFAALSSLFLLGFSGQYSTWLPILTGLSLLSMTAGNLLAIGQSNVKRLLGYSGIAHIGYMLMAFATGSADGAGMLLFYGGGYVVTNVGAFLVVEAMAAQGGDDSIESFKGLAQRTPWLALAMLLFLLSLAGIPFVIGFWAKLYVFVVAWRAGLLWLVAAGAVLAVLALFYYLRIARAMYMDPPAKTESVRVALPLRVAILLCLAGVVGLGAYPKPLLEQAEASAKPFFSTTQIAARSGHVDSP